MDRADCRRPCRALKREGVLLAVAATFPALLGGAQEVDDAPYLDEVVIVGKRGPLDQAVGSAYHLDEEALERLGRADIQRVLRQVPGVSVQIEDGYGLRPNISIRGVATERSARITLLEDNVLIAPAPYSAPSAYYFPTAGRMAAVEVLTGPAAITQGPYTIGGALNMVSTPVPEERAGFATLEAGEDATWRLHAHYGGRAESGLGFLAETHQWRSDGFQDVDRGGDSGLDLTDHTAKLSWAPSNSPHRLDLKYQYAEQRSDQSYLGLTDADFATAPFRRYGLSALDHIETEHEQLIARYLWQPSDSAALSVAFYDNSHARDWFKSEGIDVNGSPNAETLSRISWASVMQEINLGADLRGLSAAAWQQILDGTRDTAAGSIQLRSNARQYGSKGYQTQLTWRGAAGGFSHQVNFGVRYHEDFEDRLQRNSSYSQVHGALRLDDLGRLGNAGNRLQEAQAWSAFLIDEILRGNWKFTAGVRYENIDQQRTRWETRPGRTQDPASRLADNFRSSRRNETEVWLPGVGAVYVASERFAFFGGVHKGFTAPSNAPGVNEETALNYEAGLRFFGDGMRGEAAWFLSDYDNLLGECTSSSGVDCMIGDAFNGDAATVHGFELRWDATLRRDQPVQVPVSVAYTHINGEFDTDIADTDFFGNVQKGDPLPYIPEHQLHVTAGLAGERWEAWLSANHVGAVCTRASCGPFERTDGALILDVYFDYRATERVEVFARVENASRETAIMGRQPYGARPNKDRTASAGVRVRF